MPDPKQVLRKKVWKLLKDREVARFPLPIEGRIPNFKGSEKAAEKLRELPAYRAARTVKINPDAPQLPVRVNALRDGKLIYIPTPRLKGGFLELDPFSLPLGRFRTAATISGASRFGKLVSIDKMHKIDLVICGAVAVNRNGAKLGKSGGYSDREYAILRQMRRWKPPVATTVHPLQILKEKIPMKSHDVPVDFIVTPGETIKTSTKFAKPDGIDWKLVTKKDLAEMPILRELQKER